MLQNNLLEAILRAMNKIAFFIFILLAASQVSDNTCAAGTRYQLCFTPGENCTDLIVKQINNAKKSILVQAYSFGSRKIARALVRAHKRKVAVKVIFDKSQFNPDRYSLSGYLRKEGVPIWNDSKLNIAHNKVMIFDDAIVETGSFNFTYSAQHYNAENVLIIYSKVLAERYTGNWYRRQHVSKLINPNHAQPNHAS